MKGYRQSRLQQDIAIQCRRTELQARSRHLDSPEIGRR